LQIKELASKSEFDTIYKIEIFIETLGGVYPLSSLLPDSWHFAQKKGARLHTDPYRKLVVVPMDYFNNIGNNFSLVHETGHAHIDETKEYGEIDEEIYLRDKLNHMGKLSFSESEKIRYKTLVIACEIEAWKYAIDKIIQLKEKGVNLEPQLSIKDLKDIAGKKLKTYLLE